MGNPTQVVARAITYAPASYSRTKILDPYTRLVISRFTGGWTPATRNAVVAAGGISTWFAQQLSPAAISDGFYVGSRDWWISTTADAPTLWARDRDGIEPAWVANAQYQSWSVLRRIYSQRQVLEAMTAFWEHHFHVPANSDAPGLFRAHYGQMIRKHALGRFDTLLQAAITHPAMGAYLGNATSKKSAPNENLGRELLELHTVGRESGYTEDDIKNSARILTGWRVDLWRTWIASYDPASHWTGPVSVLGFSHPNADSDGRAVTAAYLTYLARHPATAHRIARKLAQRFVSDNPSTALVRHLAAVYLANDTAIAPVLKALVTSTEFRDSAGKKVRTPEDDLIATYRSLGVKIAAPTQTESAANQIVWQAGTIGLYPFSWPRPDGRPDTAAAWSSASRMLGSFQVHLNTAGGWGPQAGITYRKRSSWLPASQIRFDYLVDHLSRTLVGRGSTSHLLEVACRATGIRPGDIITSQHALVRWQMPHLLTVFLDSPQFLTR